MDQNRPLRKERGQKMWDLGYHMYVCTHVLRTPVYMYAHIVNWGYDRMYGFTYIEVHNKEMKSILGITKYSYNRKFLYQQLLQVEDFLKGQLALLPYLPKVLRAP